MKLDRFHSHRRGGGQRDESLATYLLISQNVCSQKKYVLSKYRAMKRT